MQPRTYALALGGSGILLFFAVAAANLLIDPQGVFGTGVIPTEESNQRNGRFVTYEASADTYDGLVFGSSRVIDISREELSRRMNGVTFASFSVDLGQITDHLPVLEYVLKQKAAKRQRLKAVFLLLDLDYLGGRPRTNESLHFMLPPALSGESHGRFWWRNLTGLQYRAWSAAIAKVWQSRHFTGSPAAVQSTIQRVAAASAMQATAAEFAEAQVSHDPAAAPALTTITDRLDFQNQLRLLDRFVALCRQQQVALIVATAPLNRTLAVEYDPTDLRRAADLTSQIVPIWNFTAGLPDDPGLWRDRYHFQPIVGQRMLDRIFGEKMPPEWSGFGRFQVERYPGE